MRFGRLDLVFVFGNLDLSLHCLGRLKENARNWGKICSNLLILGLIFPFSRCLFVIGIVLILWNLLGVGVEYCCLGWVWGSGVGITGIRLRNSSCRVFGIGIERLCCGIERICFGSLDLGCFLWCLFRSVYWLVFGHLGSHRSIIPFYFIFILEEIYIYRIIMMIIFFLYYNILKLKIII